jgi:uncharacterized protein YcfL
MKTSNYFVLALAVGAVALCGCTTTVNSVENTQKTGQPLVMNDTRVVTDTSLGRSVDVVAVNTITTSAGFLKVQVQLKNHTFSRQNFLYHFEWFDINGMQVNNVVSASLPDQIEGGETKFITGMAPNPDCKDFRLKFIAGD